MNGGDDDGVSDAFTELQHNEAIHAESNFGHGRGENPELDESGSTRPPQSVTAPMYNEGYGMQQYPPHGGGYDYGYDPYAPEYGAYGGGYPDGGGHLGGYGGYPDPNYYGGYNGGGGGGGYGNYAPPPHMGHPGGGGGGGGGFGYGQGPPPGGPYGYPPQHMQQMGGGMYGGGGGGYGDQYGYGGGGGGYYNGYAPEGMMYDDGPYAGGYQGAYDPYYDQGGYGYGGYDGGYDDQYMDGGYNNGYGGEYADDYGNGGPGNAPTIKTYEVKASGELKVDVPPKGPGGLAAPGLNDRLRIAVPSGTASGVLTDMGSYKEGKFRISDQGLRINKSTSSELPLPKKGGTGGASSEFVSYKTAMPNLKLSDLSIEHVVGRGSFGTVFKVRHKVAGTPMALKEIPIKDIDDETSRKQILMELSSLYKSDCPHIIAFYGAFFDGERIKLCLEYIDGGTLTEIIQTTGPMPEHIICIVAKRLVAALMYLHIERDIIHRDIKPSNILLGTNGSVKLCDFGVSGHIANTLGALNSVTGTVTYMSPERIEAQPYGFDSDLWSLGLTFIEIATGRFPYKNDGSNQQLQFWEVLHYVVETPPPTLSPEEFSPEFCDFVSSMVQTVPANRMPIEKLIVHPFLKMCPPDDLIASHILAEFVSTTDPALREREKVDMHELTTRERATRDTSYREQMYFIT